MATAKIPIGPARGKTITACTVAELEDACERVEARLCAKADYRGADKHKRFTKVARTLLLSRKFPVGAYAETEAANRALRDAAVAGHLLAAGDQLVKVLDGCSLLVTHFYADEGETFEDDDEPGRRVPAKPMLDRVASLLGINWSGSKRIDLDRHPHRRSFLAAGRYREFDGSWREIEANAEVDLSDGSVLCKRLGERYGQRAQLEILRRRHHVTSICDTAARCRAVRQLRLQPSYTVEELRRPFFVARIQFTGETDNPVASRVFSEAIAENFLSSKRGLFGEDARATGGR